MKNAIKKFMSTFFAVLIILSFSSCQHDKNSIGKSPVPMDNITQNSKNGYISFSFDIPKGWISSETGTFSIMATDKSNLDKEIENPILYNSSIINIGNYYYNSIKPSEEEVKAYDSLLKGNSDSYKEIIINSLKESNLTLSEYQCMYYDGKNGKIAQVQFSYIVGDNTVTEIRCFRDDIPHYMVAGMINDNLELSSGEIALWVMDSLKISEHFSEHDGVIQKEG